MKKIRNIVLLFSITFSVVAQSETKNLPEGTVLVAENMIFTKDNFGVSPHYFYPTNWYGGGYPVAYDYYPVASTILKAELLNQYESAGWVRNFYPAAHVLWNPKKGIGQNALRGLLDQADFYLKQGKKFLWTPAGAFHDDGKATWVALPHTAAFEQEWLDFHTQLLTSTYTNPGGLGYTFASHPGINAYEPFNENIRSNVANNFAGAYARSLRIVTKLFEQYKPACDIISFTVQGGNGANLTKIFNAKAESILSPKIATNNDNGTGKTAADYLDIHSHHFYQEGLETMATYKQWSATNDLSTKKVLDLHLKHAIMPYKTEITDNVSSPLFGKALAEIPFWNTESGYNPGELTPAYKRNVANTRNVQGDGFRSFMLDEDEAFYAVLKWFAPISFYLRDGKGGSGVNFAYKMDLPGIPYQGSLSSSGIISDIRKGENGVVRITTSNNPANNPENDWLENMRIVITAPAEGWYDLGLSSGEQKRFAVHVVDAENGVLELKNTCFTEAPKGSMRYNEFQLSHSFYPEEFKKLVDLMTSGPISFGWIPYEDGSKGICLVTPEVTYYTDENGTMKKWKHK